jgi:hypothetical protein
MADARPLALPFYHYGMHQVLPVGARMPARGKTVHVLFGEPMDCEQAPASQRDSASFSAAAYEALSRLEQVAHPAFRLTPA